MNERTAYEEILDFINSLNSVHLIDSTFYDEHFGNFVIRISSNGKAARFVNDRGELVFCNTEETSSCINVLFLSKCEGRLELRQSINPFLIQFAAQTN